MLKDRESVLDAGKNVSSGRSKLFRKILPVELFVIVGNRWFGRHFIFLFKVARNIRKILNNKNPLTLPEVYMQLTTYFV